jgi:hypothetical protein
LGLTFELIEMQIGRQHCVLNRILGIGCVAQLSIGASVEPWQVAHHDLLHFANAGLADIEIHLPFTSDVLYRLHVPSPGAVRQLKSTLPSNRARDDLSDCFQRNAQSEASE